MNKLKYILIGEGGVGKTSLINQYINNEFKQNYTMTTSADRLIKEITINNKKITFEIWDTPGQKTYRSINKIFMKNTDIALAVYDITNRKTFEILDTFINSLKEINQNRNLTIGVTANKSDLYEDAEVTKEEGEDYANKIKASFFESTATDHENVENIFNELTKDYIDKYGLKEETTQSNNNSQTTNIVNDEKVDIPENKQEAVKSMVIEKIDEVETVESSCYDKFSKKCNIF